MNKKRIVITGMGVVTPVGIGVDAYWNSLINGVSGVDYVKAFDVTKYPTKIAAEIKNFNPEDFIDKKKIRKMDRFVHFAVAASKLAIENAKLDMTKEDPYRVGIIVGSGIGGLNVIETQNKILLEKGPDRISPFLIPMLITNIAAGEIAIIYGMKGPNYSISSACATSAHCIGDALRLMRYGDADVVIAGGSEAAITPLGFGGFCAIKALSCRNDDPKGASRPFDKNRDGFIMGEGSGVLVLETLEHAVSRGAKIYAELAGYGATDDAYHITAPDTSAEASSYAMSYAIKDAGLTPNDIHYINAHGTSTEYNDKTETNAIKKVFKENAYKIPISSTKSMTGHLLGAAGAIEAIASIMSINTNIIHPTINYSEKDPECDLDYVPNTKREVSQVNAILSNSLGFGGHNASLVIKKFND
jgi:3-oxoacyl-[acyl-carrier-protein] synthase II